MTLLPMFKNIFSFSCCNDTEYTYLGNHIFAFFNSMNEKTTTENDSLNHSEEYWREESPFEENEPYFPLEEAKPPHY